MNTPDNIKKEFESYMSNVDPIRRITSELTRLKTMEKEYINLKTMIGIFIENDLIANETVIRITPHDVICGRSWEEVIRNVIKFKRIIVNEKRKHKRRKVK